MEQARKLTVGDKVGWAVGELSVATYIGLTIAFLLFYSTQALGISPWLAGLVLLMPRLWDAFTDPMMGVISDRTKTSMGRRRPYLFVGAIVLGLSTFGLFWAPAGAPELQKALYVLFFYFLASTAITIFDVPYSSMAAEMTTDYRERTSLTGYKMMAARIGIVLVLFFVPLTFGLGDTLDDGFRLVGIGFGGLMIVAGLVSFFMTRNAPRFETPVRRFSLRDEIDAVRKNKPFLALWIVFLFQNLAVGATATTVLYLLTMVLMVKPTLIGIFMGTGPILATIATPFWIYVSRKMTKRKGYYIAISLGAVAQIPILFAQPGAYVFIFTVLAIVGVADAATQLFSNAMVPDTVEVDELRSGERREGAIFGAWAFCRKLGITAGAFLVSLLLSAVGFVQGADVEAQPASAILGIRLIYCLLPSILWLIAFLLLSRYRLSEEEFNAVKARIEEKRASA